MTPHTAARAIKAYASDHCDLESVVEHSGPIQGAKLTLARRWLYRRVLRRKDAHAKWTTRDAFYSAGEVDIPGNNAIRRLWWEDYHPVGIPERQRLVLRSCLFVVKRIDLVDS